jgi:hypothetical protein
MKDRAEDEISLRRTSRQGAGRPKKAAETPPSRTPRVARLMALAIKFQGMIDRGEIRDYAELARLGFVTRARLTQIMNLLLLAPDLQEALLVAVDITSIPERSLREVIKFAEWREQRKCINLAR